MSFRAPLAIVSLATLTVAASLACSSSTSSPMETGNDGGNGMKDGGSGKKDGGSTSTSATDAEVSACSASAKATCALQEKCNPAAQQAQYGSGGTCETREQIACFNGLTSPNTGANVSHTEGCTQSIPGESCTDDLDLMVPSACRTETGGGATGSACSHPAQCSSAFCAIPPQSNCGTCQPQPAAGDSCANLSTCGQGLLCAGEVCVAYATSPGAMCVTTTQPCGFGLDCVTKKGATSGQCMASGQTVGATCDPTLETSGGCNTQIGLYCQKSSLSCQTAATATANSPCGKVGGVGTDCVNSTCFKQPGDAGSMCIAHAADNGSCDTLTGPDCTPPARCVGTQLDGGTKGTCSLPATTCPAP